MERIIVESLDPILEAGSTHTAHAQMHNPSVASFSYSAELYLGNHAATSGMVSFSLAPGETKTVNFTITMPTNEATYHVYLDVYEGGNVIGQYQGTEDVTTHVTPAIVVGPISWD